MPGDPGPSFLQGGEDVLARVQADITARAYQKPRVPPTPTLATDAFQLGDGSTAASITVTWTPVRKDLDYIVQWRKATESNETYERARTSPHVIRPVETGVEIRVGLAAEYRQTGSRSGFSADASITAAADNAPPATPTGVTATVNQATGAIVVSWNPNTEADLAFYTIYRDGSVAVPAFAGTTYQDQHPGTGTNHTYRIQAVDRSGNRSGLSAPATATVAFVGTISVPSINTPFITVPTALTAVVTQPITIPPGSRFLNASVAVSGNVISSAPNTLGLRFSLNSAGTRSSNLVTVVATTVGEWVSADLKSAAPLDISGGASIIYEWQNFTTGLSSFYFASAGGIQVTAS